MKEFLFFRFARAFNAQTLEKRMQLVVRKTHLSPNGFMRAAD
jgi:hypothetical protein